MHMLIERNTDLYNETTDTCTAEERDEFMRDNETKYMHYQLTSKQIKRPKYTIIALISLSN